MENLHFKAELKPYLFNGNGKINHYFKPIIFSWVCNEPKPYQVSAPFGEFFLFGRWVDCQAWGEVNLNYFYIFGFVGWYCPVQGLFG